MRYKLNDIAEFNPKESIKKGSYAKKVAMEHLRPFSRYISSYRVEPFYGGAKFRNGDTIMARITPCLENGKIAQVNILDNNEVGFGSTEYIVLRAKESILDKNYLFYMICSPIIRDVAIKSMVGSSGRQRVQIDVMQNFELDLPSLQNQKKIAAILSSLDEQIQLNNTINDNLQQQAFLLFERLLINSAQTECTLDCIASINPKRNLSRNKIARCIEMSQLSTESAFPSGWEEKAFNGGMRFANGDTLLARITPCLENGKAAFINFLDPSEVAFGSTEYIVLASKGIVPPEFLYCLVRSSAFREYAIKNMNGSSGRQRVSADSIGNFKLPHPKAEALMQFQHIVSPFFQKMKFNFLENLHLTALRDTLLPKLMSGEIDVSDIAL